MNKSPAFQFYPKDWLSDKKVRRLTFEEKGVYLELLCHMWSDSNNQCSIENDVALLKNILKISRKKIEKILKNFQKPGLELFEIDNKTIISKRLRKEKEKQAKTSIKRQEAANKRWKENKSNSNAFALQKECLAISSSISLKNLKDILSFWNDQIIIKHNWSDKIHRQLVASLNSYTVEQLKEAILNYSKILKSKDHFLSYKWTLITFLKQQEKNSIETFLNINNPLERYKGYSHGQNNQPNRPKTESYAKEEFCRDD